MLSEKPDERLNVSLNISKAKQAFGFYNRYSLKEALEDIRTILDRQTDTKL